MNDFIFTKKIQNTKICDMLINYHENSNLKYEGKYHYGNQIYIDKSVKDSIDVCLEDVNLINIYVTMLKDIIEEYVSLYKFCNEYSPWTIVEPIYIQKYPINCGFHKWHTERTSSVNPVCNRHLVFMTYLNDVNDEGETEFFYQNCKIKPEKGLTVIWPADWTHTHRGISSKTQEKYIITGWFNFITSEEMQNE